MPIVASPFRHDSSQTAGSFYAQECLLRYRLLVLRLLLNGDADTDAQTCNIFLLIRFSENHPYVHSQLIHKPEPLFILIISISHCPSDNDKVQASFQISEAADLL